MNPEEITSKSICNNPLKYINGDGVGFGFGGQVFWSSKNGQNFWIGIGTGFGFNYGGSCGKGKTYLGWR